MVNKPTWCNTCSSWHPCILTSPPPIVNNWTCPRFFVRFFVSSAFLLDLSPFLPPFLPVSSPGINRFFLAFGAEIPVPSASGRGNVSTVGNRREKIPSEETFMENNRSLREEIAQQALFSCCRRSGLPGRRVGAEPGCGRICDSRGRGRLVGGDRPSHRGLRPRRRASRRFRNGARPHSPASGRSSQPQGDAVNFGSCRRPNWRRHWRRPGTTTKARVSETISFWLWQRRTIVFPMRPEALPRSEGYRGPHEIRRCLLTRFPYVVSFLCRSHEVLVVAVSHVRRAVRFTGSSGSVEQSPSDGRGTASASPSARRQFFLSARAVNDRAFSSVNRAGPAHCNASQRNDR